MAANYDVAPLCHADANVRLRAAGLLVEHIASLRGDDVPALATEELTSALKEIVTTRQFAVTQVMAISALESLTKSAPDACVALGVPTTIIGLLGAHMNENVEQRAIEYVAKTTELRGFRDMYIDLGAVPLLCRSVRRRGPLVQSSIWALVFLCRGKAPAPDFERVHPVLPVAVECLFHEDHYVQTEALFAISYLSDGPNYKVQATLDAGAMPPVIAMMDSHSPMDKERATRIVANVCTGTDEHAQHIIDLGVVGKLINVFRDGDFDTRKQAIYAMSNLFAGPAVHIQALMDAGALDVAMGVLDLRVGAHILDAVYCVANATSSATKEQREYMFLRGALHRLCECLSHDNVHVKEQSLNGIEKLFLHNERSPERYAVIAEKAVPQLTMLQADGELYLCDKASLFLADFQQYAAEEGLQHGMAAMQLD